MKWKEGIASGPIPNTTGNPNDATIQQSDSQKGFKLSSRSHSSNTGPVDFDEEADRLEKEDILNQLLESTQNLIDHGSYDDAISILQRVVDGRRALLGEENADTLLALNSLASVYKTVGRVGDAELCYRKVYQGKSRQLGESHG